MLDRLIATTSHLSVWYFTSRRTPILGLLRWIVTLGIPAASVLFIWTQVSRGYTAISGADIRLDFQCLIISWLSIASCTALGAWEWTLLVNALGGRMGLLRGMRIHLVSNLSKYVPGYIWPYIGKTYLTTQQGVPANIAGLSVVAEFGIVLLDGALVLALSLPFSGITTWSTGQRITLELSALLFAGATIVGLPCVGRWLVNRLRGSNLIHGGLGDADWGRVCAVIAAVLLTWCLLGFGFSILDASVSPQASQDTLRQTAALAAAMVIGQLAPFVPMGLGVREAILVALLSPARPVELVLLVALMFRVEIMIGEVVCASTFLLLDRTRRNTQITQTGD